MQRFLFHRSLTGLFNEQQNRLVYDQESLLPFINRTFSLENCANLLAHRQDVDRELLVDELKKQYSGLRQTDLVIQNLDLLREKNTFTITTGHQLSLFTGPLFFVVKILHTIKLTKELQAINPDNNFVPVYWMASEDHDFDEIKSSHLFSKTLTWNADQKGPVGRFELDEGFENVVKEFKEFFGQELDEVHQLLDSYSGKDLASATRSLVNELFGRFGLIIIDGDSKKLKESFSGIMKKELLEQFSEKQVLATNQKLEREGLSLQVKPRRINLFYLKDGFRKGIELSGEAYQIPEVGTFSKEEILNLLEKEPESFSPNVVLRPLYQEFLLPNLAYIGGAGEISYWLQLKGVFEEAKVDYPMIQVRNSVLWIEPALAKRISKLDIQLEQLFQNTEDLKKWYLEVNEGDSLQNDKLMSALQVLKVELSKYVVQADPTLAAFASAELVKLDKQIEFVVSKVKKSAKTKHENAMNGIEVLKSRLFPEGGLQERKVSFFQFVAQGDVTAKMDMLYQIIDPMEKDLIVLREA